MMKEFVEKGLYAGLGLLAVTRDETESILNSLVAKGKLSAPDAEKAADEFIRHGRQGVKNFEKKASEFMGSVLDSSPLVNRNDYNALKRRVEKLEKIAVRNFAARKMHVSRSLRKIHGITNR